jgi:hypothetical protein
MVNRSREKLQKMTLSARRPIKKGERLFASIPRLCLYFTLFSSRLCFDSEDVFDNKYASLGHARPIIHSESGAVITASPAA